MDKKLDLTCYCDYEVLIEKRGSIFKGYDIDHCAIYEDFEDCDCEIICGRKLITEFCKLLSDNQLLKFKIYDNKLKASFFNPDNGSGYDVFYIILREIC